jgi:hypothetical protein
MFHCLIRDLPIVLQPDKDACHCVLSNVGIFAGKGKSLVSDSRFDALFIYAWLNILPSAFRELSRLQWRIVSKISKWKRA